MTRLSVNINKIATIRNARGGNMPDVEKAALDCERFGAEGITVHPRPDERHIRYSDVREIRPTLSTEFNIEGNPFMNLMEHAESARPHQLTFVPDDAAQKTSDHGFDLEKSAKDLLPLIRRGHELGARVSIFMDPVPEQMALAKEIGADRVELYTESYAAACGTIDEEDTLRRYAAAARAAYDAGLGVNAGHDLSLTNLLPLLVACENIAEVSIGHALVSEALQYGMTETVGRYNGVLLEAADRICAKTQPK